MGRADGDVDPGRGYGEQRDLAHMSKVYAELCLALYARRTGFAARLAATGIVYGRSPVEHRHPSPRQSSTSFVVWLAPGEPLPLDAGGAATIGVVDVPTPAGSCSNDPTSRASAADNVAAETLTVGGHRGARRGGEPAAGQGRLRRAFPYQHRLSRSILAARA